MIEFRTGTHNPLTLYVASEPYGPHQGQDLPGWMRDGEWSIGWLPHEGLAALAVEAWNAFVCRACPWGCPSCSLNRATCECYEHQDRIDENGQPVDLTAALRRLEAEVLPPSTHAPALGIEDSVVIGDFTEIARAAREGRPVNPKAFAVIKNVGPAAAEPVPDLPPCGMHYSWQAHGTVSAGSIGPCVLTGEHVDHRDQYGNEWPVTDSAVGPLCEETLGSTRCQLPAGHDSHRGGGRRWSAFEVVPVGDMRSRRQGGRGLVATGGIITNPQPLAEQEEREVIVPHAPADGPVVEPPPVDAKLILGLVEEYAMACTFAPRDEDEANTRHSWRNRITEAIHEKITALWASGVAEGRRLAADDLTTWLDQLAARLPQYNQELSVCTRSANAGVLGAYERAATIARSGLDRNPHCSTCGDTRGGPRGHETSECTWDMRRWPDLLRVPRDAPDRQATEERTGESRGFVDRYAQQREANGG